MEERQYEETINWEYNVRVTGHRIFMVKPWIKSKLAHSSQEESKNRVDTMKSVALEQSHVSNLGYFQNRVELLEQLKRKSDINQDRIVYTDAVVQSLIEQIQGLEIHSETQITDPNIFTSETQMTYSDTIHEKVDTILKGTENDPIGRAQFDSFISRISQAYEETKLDIKSPKEK